MRAFHNDPEIKEKYLARVRAHRLADEIVKRRYWEDGKGCAVGCTLHSSNHLAYETELGIPVQLAYLEDTIFENLPNELAMKWPERFLNAAKVGADLSHVADHFFIWMLTDGIHGVIRFAHNAQTSQAIQAVSDLYQRKANGETVSQYDWAAAEAAARAAAAAAWAAWAARAAAWAAWAAEAAEAAAYTSFADKLIELMENANV